MRASGGGDVDVLRVEDNADDVDLTRRAFARGANGYVRKLVSSQQLVEAARSLGVYWLELNEPPPPEGLP